MKFSIKDFFSKCDQIRSFPADLVTFTEEMLKGKFNFFAVKALHLSCLRGPSYASESYDFLTFSGVIEMKHRGKMG